MENDLVNHPKHYISKDGLEVIDAIEKYTEHLVGIQATDTGNVIKYICRWKKKNGIQDLEKAMWYVKHLMNHVTKQLESGHVSGYAAYEESDCKRSEEPQYTLQTIEAFTFDLSGIEGYCTAKVLENICGWNYRNDPIQCFQNVIFYLEYLINHLKAFDVQTLKNKASKLVREKKVEDTNTRIIQAMKPDCSCVEDIYQQAMHTLAAGGVNIMGACKEAMENGQRTGSKGE